MSEETRDSQIGLLPETSNSRGVSRRTFLGKALRVAGGVAVATLAPVSALEAFAKTANAPLAEAGATPALTELSQKNHEIAIEYVDVSRENQKKYIAGWYRNVVGQPIEPNWTEIAKPENIGNGYTSWNTEGPEGSIQRTITDPNRIVVYKNINIGPIAMRPVKPYDINPIIRSTPVISDAPEFGPDKMRMSFIDRGIALVGPKSDDWQSADIDIVEGFIGTQNPAEYNASPWLNTSNQQASAEAEPGAGIADNPQ